MLDFYRLYCEYVHRLWKMMMANHRLLFMTLHRLVEKHPASCWGLGFNHLIGDHKHQGSSNLAIRGLLHSIL